MEISDKLLCLFNADVRTENDRYVVGIPCREVETGAVEPGETYHVALISRESNEPAESEPDAGSAPTNEPQLPTETDELHYVEIGGIDKQGDGITRVERGYVIIVPGTEVGECMKVGTTEAKSNFVVGEVVEDDF